MICEKCARKLPGDWSFCVYCGGRAVPEGQPGLCPKCGLEVPGAAAYCKRCGARLTYAEPPDTQIPHAPPMPPAPHEPPKPIRPPSPAPGADLWPSSEASGLPQGGGEGIPSFVWWIVCGTVLFAAIMVVVIAATLSGYSPAEGPRYHTQAALPAAAPVSGTAALQRHIVGSGDTAGTQWQFDVWRAR